MGREDHPSHSRSITFDSRLGIYRVAVCCRPTRALFDWFSSQRRRALKGEPRARQEQPGFPVFKNLQGVVMSEFLIIAMSPSVRSLVY